MSKRVSAKIEIEDFDIRAIIARYEEWNNEEAIDILDKKIEDGKIIVEYRSK